MSYISGFNSCLTGDKMSVKRISLHLYIICFLNMIVAALFYVDQKVSLILTLPDILAALLYSKVALKAFNEDQASSDKPKRESSV